MTEQFDLKAVVDKALEDALKERRVATILIAGPTGVGKSSLINAVFSGRIAEVGQGRPITKIAREYTKEGIPLRLIDTRGIETADYEATKQAISTLIGERQMESDLDRHIHVAWLCIEEGSRRVQDSDKELAKLLSDRQIPTIAVITKARQDKAPSGESFKSIVEWALPQCRQVVSVRAVREVVEGSEPVRVREPKGLVELIDVTIEAAPEGYRRALVAAQRVDIARKVKLSRSIMGTAATAAAAAAAAPIPFSDALLLVPIQIGMFAAISTTFGLPIDQASLQTLIAAVVGGGGAAIAGRALVANLLKFVPGANAVGMAINAAVASSLTLAIGEAFIQVLDRLYSENDGETPDIDRVIEEFKASYSSRSSKG